MPLSPNEQRIRAAALFVLPAALWLLRSLPTGGLPSWVPWQTSCGAITGLPCIFCGMTRALHHLLNGDIPRALYFNWLAFPLLATAVLFCLRCVVELCLGRRLRLPRIPLTRWTVSAALAGLVLLWSLQVYLAVSQHKRELLNPAGPLYSLVVH